MNISTKTPLIYYFLKIFFPKIKKDTAIITWKGICYTKNELPEYLRVHESIHLAQQDIHGPYKFLFKYIFSKDFRRLQEFQAYKVQYRWMLDNGFNHKEARRLSLDQLDRLEYRL